MSSKRIVLYGNSGAGKTTLAKRLADEHNVPRSSLDDLAWAEWAVRRPLDDSVADLQAFFAAHAGWVVEGCYAELIEAALPYCTELVFLNPGVEVCVSHCRSRSWEPDKYASVEQQQAALSDLIDWVREYEGRDDEYGLARHRAIFEGFNGTKREITEPDAV